MSQHPLPEKLREIDEAGVAVVPSVLGEEIVSALRDLLQKCVDEDLEAWRGKPYPDAWMVHNLMARDIAFAGVMENPTLQAYLTATLGETCIVYAYTSSSMPPNATNYSGRVHVDCPRFIPDYVTNMGVMLALDDFTDENGATWFLPGSHKHREAPGDAEFNARAIRVYPKAGDGVFFNARTFHRGGQNRTTRARHALTLNVCRAYMRQRFDYPRLVPPEIVAQLGAVGRRFLGFNVRMPTTLAEYYLPEDQRLYQAGQG